MKKTIIALSIVASFCLFSEENEQEYTQLQTKEYTLDIHDSVSGGIISLFNIMKGVEPQSGETKTVVKTEYVVDEAMQAKLEKFKIMLNEKLRSDQLKQTFHFKTAKSELLSDQTNYLENIVLSLEGYENLQYEILGYSDARGNEEYNFQLSMDRINSVVSVLQSLGVDNSNITLNNFGEAESQNSNDFESYFFDRKVELIIKK